MGADQPTRILLVARGGRRRADAGPCEFTLWIPDVRVSSAADWTLATGRESAS